MRKYRTAKQRAWQNQNQTTPKPIAPTAATTATPAPATPTQATTTDTATSGNRNKGWITAIVVIFPRCYRDFDLAACKAPDHDGPAETTPAAATETAANTDNVGNDARRDNGRCPTNSRR